MTTAHRLKITLAGIRPPIWRRVLVDSEATLGELHLVIQAAFGWLGGHLYDFEITGTRYGPSVEDEEEGDAEDEETVNLAQVADAGARFTYTYDFGDDWRHDIEVEAVEPTTPEISLPTCTDGRRSGPPEDCGGPSGYAHLLSALADSNHPDHDEQLDWVGPHFDPEEFDLADFPGAFEAGPPVAEFF